MNIIVSKRLSRLLNLKTEKKDRGNAQNLWIMSILTDVAPEYNDYIYLTHVNTNFGIIKKLDDDWEDDIEGEVKRAFAYFFDTYEERGDGKIGSYRNELEEINFLPYERDLRKVNSNSQVTQAEFKQLYKQARLYKKNAWTSPLEFEIFNRYKNDQQNTPSVPSPQLRFGKMLKKYQNGEIHDVPFEENRDALELPFHFTLTNLGGAFGEPTLLMDTARQVFKEPQEENLRKVEELSRQISEMGPRIAGKKINKKKRSRMNKLLKQVNELLWYDPTSYTGLYKELEIPEKLPEKTVFEFLVTLESGFENMEIKRRFLVPADMSFKDFDRLLSHLFKWGGFPYHLSSFLFSSPDKPEDEEIIEMLEHPESDYPEEVKRKPVDLAFIESSNPFYNVKSLNMNDYQLKDYFPEHKTAQYRYDYGDNWYHAVELVGIHDGEKIDKELPYLIESVGTAPPDDVGGFNAFEELIEGNADFFIDEDQFFFFMENWIDDRNDPLRAPGTLAPLFEK